MVQVVVRKRIRQLVLSAAFITMLVSSMWPALAYAGDLAVAMMHEGEEVIDPYEGTAYAVLTGKGALIFFRSHEEYSAGAGQTVYDVAGNSYTGTVYTDFEDKAAINAYADVPWYVDRWSVKTVSFAEGQRIRPYTCRWWFSGFIRATKVDVSGLDTSEVTNMAAMFSFMGRDVTSIDVSHFDTSHVTTMSWMFANDRGLKAMDLSSFDTSNVRDMSWMFSECDGLTSLDISTFDTSKVESMRNMFSQCSALQAIDVVHFDTSHVTDMSYMFNESKLHCLDVSNFDTSHVTTFERMFYGCGNMTTLDISGFDTHKATTMSLMFSRSDNLSRVSLGPAFSFAGNGGIASSKYALLPTPSSDDGVHNGKWTPMDAGGAAQFTPEELRDLYDGATMAGVYVWAVGANRINFAANGGSGSMAPVDVVAGQSFVIPSCEYACDGCVFAGWNTRADGSGERFGAGDTILPEEDLMLFAQWEERQIILEVPDEISLTADSAGMLLKLSEAPVSFTNKGNVDVSISGIRIQPAEGAAFVANPENAGEFEVRISFDRGASALKLSDYAAAEFAAPNDADELMVPAGESLQVTEVSGRTGGVDVGSGTAKASVGAITWRFSALSD